MKPDVQYVRNGDVSLAYPVVGSGARDLLLMSGAVSNLEYTWEYPSLARFLSRLAQMSRLVLNDARGSGLSDRFREAPPQETKIRDLEVILDEVGSAKATLFGSWDGCATHLVRRGEPPTAYLRSSCSVPRQRRSPPMTTRGAGRMGTGKNGLEASEEGGALGHGS